MRETSQAPITLLRCKSVLERTGLKRSSLYNLISKGEFPKPIKITAKAAAWPSNDVENWVLERISAGQQAIQDEIEERPYPLTKELRVCTRCRVAKASHDAKEVQSPGERSSTEATQIGDLKDSSPKRGGGK